MAYFLLALAYFLLAYFLLAYSLLVNFLLASFLLTYEQHVPAAVQDPLPAEQRARVVVPHLHG